MLNASLCPVQGGTAGDRSPDSLDVNEKWMSIECKLTEEVEDDITGYDVCGFFDAWDTLNETLCGCDVTSDRNASWCCVQVVWNAAALCRPPPWPTGLRVLRRRFFFEESRRLRVICTVDAPAVSCDREQIMSDTYMFGV